MKKLIIQFIQFLFSNPKFFLKFKDIALCNPAEHLYRTVQFVNIHELNSFGTHILDIGVANGATANFFSKHFPNHKIIGFEPVNKSFELATSQTKNNKKIYIHNVALADFNGESFINITNDSLASSLNDINPLELEKDNITYNKKFDIIESQKTNTSKLDDVLDGQEKILILKIDTQGTELTVFRGAINTLKRTKLILIEMNNHHLYRNSCQYFEVDEFLRLNGFILKDIYVTYREKGNLKEFDSLYINTKI